MSHFDLLCRFLPACSFRFLHWVVFVVRRGLEDTAFLYHSLYDVGNIPTVVNARMMMALQFHVETSEHPGHSSYWLFSGIERVKNCFDIYPLAKVRRPRYSFFFALCWQHFP